MLTKFDRILPLFRNMALAMVAGGLFSPAASAALLSGFVTYELQNHPYGVAPPDLSGLRLDNLDGSGREFTFDFDHPDAAGMTLIYDRMSKEIRIVGEAFGGAIVGSRPDLLYGTDTDAVGVWSLDFLFSGNVMDNGATDPKLLEIWVTAADGQANTGQVELLRQTDGTPVVDGAVYDIYEDVSSSNGGVTFELRPDGHPTSGGVPAPPGVQSGRGWLSYNADNSPSARTQDWLFVAVPEPSVAMLLGLGGLGILFLRRR